MEKFLDVLGVEPEESQVWGIMSESIPKTAIFSKELILVACNACRSPGATWQLVILYNPKIFTQALRDVIHYYFSFLISEVDD